MPTIFIWNGYRFFFFSNEGDPREPLHIHVRKGSAVAKFWLEPEVQLANSWGFGAKDLTRLDRVVRERHIEIRSRWNEYFGS